MPLAIFAPHPIDNSFSGPHPLQSYNPPPTFNFHLPQFIFFDITPLQKIFHYRKTLTAPQLLFENRTSCGIAGYLIMSNAVSVFPFC